MTQSPEVPQDGPSEPTNATQAVPTPPRQIVTDADVSGSSPPSLEPPQPNFPTPSAGLINQGCTCYLNSLLQLLFHLGYFRSAVYRMTVDNLDDSPQIPQALQSLFFQMQERLTAPTTRGLTDAFGWDERELFTQHDIQELAALLRDCLESRMRGTPSEGAINKLFEGVGEQVVQTLDGSYTSRTKDTFFDIHLPIQGFNNIIESLRSLTVKDQLVGDNKYKVEQEGMPPVYKDAEKGYRFVQLPPVIFFHLKRFEMDLMSPTLEMKKINNMFEFSEELNLREFEDAGGSAEVEQRSQLSRPAAAVQDEFDRDSQAVYDLVGVIVHKGTARSGHYYCYIRHYDAQQGAYTHWIEYDDENVRIVDSTVAVEANFGGMRSSTVHGRPHTYMSTNSAYILSYVRRSDRAVLLAPSPTDIIPESIKRELRRIMELDEKRSMVEKVRRSQIRVVLATDEAIARCVQVGIVDLLSRDERVNPYFCKYVDVKKEDSFPSLYVSVSEALGKEQFAHDRIRLWKWQLTGPDKSIYRPTFPLRTYDESPVNLSNAQGLLTQTMMEKDIMANILLYVERLTVLNDSTLYALTSHPPRAVRVFVKACTPRDRSVSFLGRLDVMRDHCLLDYVSSLAEMLNVDPASLTEKRFAVALEGNRICASRFLDLEQQIQSLGLVMGDILVIQPLPMSIVYRNCTAVDLIQEARQSFKIQIREKKDPTIVAGELSALYSWDYESICEGIVKMLHARQGGRAIRADHIQLFRNIDFVTPLPAEHALRSNSQLSAHDMCMIGQYSGSVLFYHLLEEPRTNLESQQKIKMRVFDLDGTRVIKDVVVTTSLPVKFSHLIAEAIEAKPVTPQKKPTGAPSPESPETHQSTSEAALGPTSPQSAQAAHTTSPTSSQAPSLHYVAQFVFEGLHRPSRAPVDVSMNIPSREPPILLSRMMCPGEWIYLFPSAPLPTSKVRKLWSEASSSDSDRGEGEAPASSELVTSSTAAQQQQQKQCIRVPVSQGEYLNSYCTASFFGHPCFVDVDPQNTTIQEVLDAVTVHYGVDANSEEIMQHPLMLVVDGAVADADHLQTERDVETFFYQSKHYRFTNLEEKIAPFLESHGERYFIYLNRKRPREKPGSRYVATNDPKLVIEKKKPSAT